MICDNKNLKISKPACPTFLPIVALEMLLNTKSKCGFLHITLLTYALYVKI